MSDQSDHSDLGGGASPGPFKYHLELTPAQLKITHTALHSLLDDFGREQPEVNEVIRTVLDKLPDEHVMRAIRLDTELQREQDGARDAPTALEVDDGEDDPGPPPVIA